MYIYILEIHLPGQLFSNSIIGERDWIAKKAIHIKGMKYRCIYLSHLYIRTYMYMYMDAIGYYIYIYTYIYMYM